MLAATAVERLGRPAQTSLRLEEKVVVAGMASDLAAVMMERSTQMPAGVILVHGEFSFNSVNSPLRR